MLERDSVPPASGMSEDCTETVRVRLINNVRNALVLLGVSKTSTRDVRISNAFDATAAIGKFNRIHPSRAIRPEETLA